MEGKDHFQFYFLTKLGICQTGNDHYTFPVQLGSCYFRSDIYRRRVFDACTMNYIINVVISWYRFFQ